MSSRSKYRLPCSPLTSNVFPFLRPLAKRVASKWPIAPLAYWQTKMEASSISIFALPPSGLSFIDKNTAGPGNGFDRPDQKIREINDVRMQIAGDARTRNIFV